MSGTLPHYRPAQVRTGKLKGFTFSTRPGGIYKDGRCVEWFHDVVPVYYHDLVPRVEAQRPSKHARGRMRPRSPKEQQRMASIARRATQLQKSWTIDRQTLSGLFMP